MRIVRPGDPDYDKDRVISNARFDYSPWAIYYWDPDDFFKFEMSIPPQ